MKRIITLALAAMMLTSISHGIGESPEHYDQIFGPPHEFTEQRSYLTKEWRVHALFENGRATAVSYVRIRARTESGIEPEVWSNEDAVTFLERHDPQSEGWRHTHSDENEVHWIRNDGNAEAKLLNESILNVYSLNKTADRQYTKYASEPVETPDLTEAENELVLLSQRVIEEKTDYLLESVSFIGLRTETNPDGNHVYIVDYKIDDTETKTTSDGRLITTYDIITIQFHPHIGINIERASVGAGRHERSEPIR